VPGDNNKLEKKLGSTIVTIEYISGIPELAVSPSTISNYIKKEMK